MKIVISFLAGCALTYVLFAYPAQSKLAMRQAADKGAILVRDGVMAASNAADQQLADKGTLAPQKTAKK